MTDPLYLIESDYGTIGKECLGYRDHTRRNIVELIASGEWPDMVAVFEAREDERTFLNITEDIAREVLAFKLEDDFGRMAPCVRDFIEGQIGCAEFAEATAPYQVAAE